MNSKLDKAREAIEKADFVIRKIGGANAAEIKKNVERFLYTDSSQRQILVLSAIRSESAAYSEFSQIDQGKNRGFNTTSHLIALAEALKAGDFGRAREMAQAVSAFTDALLNHEIEGEYVGELQAVLRESIDKLYEIIKEAQGLPAELRSESVNERGKDFVFEGQETFSFTGFGELLAQAIYERYFELRGLKVSQIDVNEVQPQENTIDSLRHAIQDQVREVVGDEMVTLCPGYLPILAQQRGYSDMTAAFIGSEVQALGKNCVLVIEKQHPILSADPRIVRTELTRVVEAMSYALAGEVFSDNQAAAAALHPNAVDIAAQNTLPVVITSPGIDSRGSTLITEQVETRGRGVEIIASRPTPTRLVISSPSMNFVRGLYHRVTGHLLDFNLDSMNSTNTTITVSSFDEIQPEVIQEILRDLEDHYKVPFKIETYTDRHVVFCFGNNIDTQRAKADSELALKNAGIKPIAADYDAKGVLKFVVTEDVVADAVKVLHAAHIPYTRRPEKPRFLNREQTFEIAERFGTPTYVYSEQALRDRAREMTGAELPYGLTVRYAMKANPNKHILNIFHEECVHIDASSSYEVERALKAGIPGENIMLTAQEFPHDAQMLVDNGVIFNACSLKQLQQWGELFPGTTVSVRINPGKGSGFDQRTTVAGPKNSFGIWHEKIEDIKAMAARYNLTINKVHTHIGSGTDPDVWDEVADVSIALLDHFPEATSLNLGGGFKVGRMSYEKSTDVGEVTSRVAEKLQAYHDKTGRKIKLELEPGTFMVAMAGTLLTQVLDVKDTGDQGYKFVIVDGGMDTILRPAMYGALHPLSVVQQTPIDKTELVMVSGHCCESSDTFTPQPDNPDAIRVAHVSKVSIGDCVLVDGSGAYCSSMKATGYNSFPERPEVMIGLDGEIKVIREGGTLDELMAKEV